MYPTSTPASLLEERERSVCNNCNMLGKVRFPTNLSVFSLILIPKSIALCSLPWDPFRPVYPIETAEATLLSIFLPILLHYISTRYLKNEVVKLLTLYSGIICWGQNLPISILVPQPSSKGLQQFPRQRFCKERHR